MDSTAVFSKRKFPRALGCALVSVWAFALCMPLGLLAADWTATLSDMSFYVQECDPFAACTGAEAYAERFCALCLPSLSALLIVWIAAYTHFEKFLLSVLFAGRGFVCGMAFRLCLVCGARSGVLFSVWMFAGISLVCLALVLLLHRGNGILSPADSLTLLFGMGGIICCAVLLAALAAS